MIKVKIHIAERLKIVGEFDMFESLMRDQLINFNSDKLRPDGYVIGEIQSDRGYNNLCNCPAISYIEILEGAPSLWSKFLSWIKK